MRGTHHHRDAGLAGRHLAQPVRDAAVRDLVADAHLALERRERGQGHRAIGLVEEPLDPAAVVMVARRAHEDGDRPAIGPRGRGQHAGDVERAFHQLSHAISAGGGAHRARSRAGEGSPARAA